MHIIRGSTVDCLIVNMWVTFRDVPNKENNNGSFQQLEINWDRIGAKVTDATEFFKCIQEDFKNNYAASSTKEQMALTKLSCRE